MTEPQAHHQPDGPVPDLSALGLESWDVVAYRRLLAESSVPVEEHDDGTLVRLIDAGLVRVREGRVHPLSPRHPLQAEAGRRQREVDRLRAAAEMLVSEYRDRPGATAESLQVLVGAAEVTRAAVALVGEAQRVVRGLDRGPYFSAGPLPESAQHRSEGRGVLWRVIYEGESVRRDETGRPDIGESPGEESRMLPRLPFKMIVIDDLAALIALPPDGMALGPETDVRSGGEGLLVRGSLLVGALIRLFEQQWNLAVPVGQGAAELDQADRRLLALLSVGLTDEAMARHIGLSRRTVQRRLAELSKSVGAESRFQLGVEASRRGWV